MATKHTYTVIVGNVGTAHTGEIKARAMAVFSTYREMSRRGLGKAAHEPVALMRDGEPIREYNPPPKDTDATKLARWLRKHPAVALRVATFVAVELLTDPDTGDFYDSDVPLPFSGADFIDAVDNNLTMEGIKDGMFTK